MHEKTVYTILPIFKSLRFLSEKTSTLGVYVGLTGLKTARVTYSSSYVCECCLVVKARFISPRG